MIIECLDIILHYDYDQILKRHLLYKNDMFNEYVFFEPNIRRLEMNYSVIYLTVNNSVTGLLYYHNTE